MPNVIETLRHGGQPAQRVTVSGYVSTSRPAPASFDSDLFVIVPDYSPDYSFGPCKWGELHGQTLPVQGTPVLVVFDDQGVPVVVWWGGTANFTATAKTGNTTGLTSAQIDALFTPVPVDGTELVDTVNHWLLVRAAGSWWRTSALTQIP